MNVYERAVAWVAMMFAIGAITICITDDAYAASAASCRAIDHRSSSGGNSDNTLDGMRGNARFGVISEIDLATVSDGIVAFHENRWEQGTNGTGEVATSTMAYARTLSYVETGQQVPTLVEVLTFLKRNPDARALLEVHHPWTPEMIALLVDRVRTFGVTGQIKFTGTDGRLAQLPPEFATVWRVEGGETVTRARALSVDVIQVWARAPLAEINAWRAAGYRIWSRGAPTPVQWRNLINKRIYITQTGTPALWLSYCRRALG